jgi:predicted nucleic acid-binding Zn ribbon protein
VKDASRIGDLLQRFLRHGPLSEGLKRQQALEIWPEVVGDVIAAHSEAISLEGGVLHVRVDGSVWAQELSMLQAQIKAGFARRLGDGAVTGIRFTSSGR